MKQTIHYIILFAAIVILSSAAYSTEHMNQTVTLTAEQVSANTYELVCKADFTVSNYEWVLGDGNQTLTSLNNMIEYEFAPGNHEISCTAYNVLESMSGTANYTINVLQIDLPNNDTDLLLNLNETINETENMSNETNTSMNMTDNLTNTTIVILPMFNETDYETINLTNETQVNETNITMNETNETINETPVMPFSQNDTSLTLTYDRISNGEYRFICQPEGFTAEAYDWNFGDGTTAYDVQNNNVTHFYAMPGTKTVFCGAWSSGIYETATLRVDVNDVEPLAQVNILQNNDPTFTFSCETDAFVPDTYDWDMGDGTMNLDVSEQTWNHTYNKSGFFSVACTAWNQEEQRIVIGYTHINVTNAANEYENGESDIYIMREQLYDDTYRFSCLTPNMNPIAYDWEVYDVYGDDFERRDHDISYNMIEQTFNVDGKYVISCTATDLEKTIIDWQFLTIQGTNSQHMIVQETSDNNIPDHVTQLLVTDNRATVILSRESRGDLLVTVQTELEKVIDLRALVENNRATIPGRITFESETEQRVIVRIPANTTITADGTWDGILLLPHQGSLSDNMNLDVTSVIRIGADTPLSFDKAIRMVFVNRGGEQIAIEHNNVLNNVTRICEADNQAYGNALPAETSCIVSIDGDLVLWTKSFSQFITYRTSESTPQLQVTQEQRTFNTALDERERRTMQTYDIESLTVSESPSAPGAPTSQVTDTDITPPNNLWTWAILAFVLIGIIIAISIFRNSGEKNNTYPENRDNTYRRKR